MSRAWTSRGPRTHRVHSVVSEMSSRFWTMYQFTAPFRGPKKGVPSKKRKWQKKNDAAGVGHDTPVSDQVSDNGTEHSGISVPGPGRLATGKIIKRRPSEVLRDEEVTGSNPVSPTSITPSHRHIPPHRQGPRATYAQLSQGRSPRGNHRGRPWFATQLLPRASMPQEAPCPHRPPLWRLARSTTTSCAGFGRRQDGR